MAGKGVFGVRIWAGLCIYAKVAIIQQLMMGSRYSS
jgi:hypothetical protein